MLQAGAAWSQHRPAGASPVALLMDLRLPIDLLAVALLGFNLGVETGQIAIPGTILPLFYLLADKAWRTAVLGGASASIAAVWCVQRLPL